MVERRLYSDHIIHAYLICDRLSTIWGRIELEHKTKPSDHK